MIAVCVLCRFRGWFSGALCPECSDQQATARALDFARMEMLAKVRALPACESEMRREVASSMAGGTADGPTQRGWDPAEYEG